MFISKKYFLVLMLALSFSPRITFAEADTPVTDIEGLIERETERDAAANPAAGNVPTPRIRPPHAPAPEPAAPVASTPPAADDENVDFHAASLWASVVESSEPWTNVVIKVVGKRLDDLEKANDVETFCPGYKSASLTHRKICWLRLVGGIVEFESNFTPHEPPFYEGDGIFSVGLMALSSGECEDAPNGKDLMNPVKNLRCGVNRMAKLIAKGKSIENKNNKGASAYWSVLRPAYKYWDPVRKKYLKLGKKEKIIERTKTYKTF